VHTDAITQEGESNRNSMTSGAQASDAGHSLFEGTGSARMLVVRGCLVAEQFHDDVFYSEVGEQSYHLVVHA